MKQRTIPKPSLGFRFTAREEYYIRLVCAKAAEFMAHYGQPSDNCDDEKVESDGKP